MTASSDVNGIYFETKVVTSTLAAIEEKVPLLIQQGGSYSGKTFGIECALYWYAYSELSPKPLLISVVGCTFPHLKRGALRDFETIVDALGGVKAHNKTDSTYKIGNCTIEFFSADDNNKVRGSKRDILFVNECNLINYERYRQLALRTRQTVILDFNPVEDFWLHEKILPFKDDYIFKRTTYRDNPATPEKVRDDIEKLKLTDPALYRVYGEGKTGQIQGLIFTKIKTVDVFPVEAKKIAYALDFGFTHDPSVLIKCGELSGEFFGKEMMHETGMTNSDLSDKFKELGLTRYDEIIADSAEPKSIEELKRKGWNIKPALKGADSIRVGISTLQSYPINLTTDSVNWRKEAKNYKWKEKDGNFLSEPIDKWNHCWDAARYYALAKLTLPKIAHQRRVIGSGDYYK